MKRYQFKLVLTKKMRKAEIATVVHVAFDATPRKARSIASWHIEKYIRELEAGTEIELEVATPRCTTVYIATVGTWLNHSWRSVEPIAS